MKKNRLRRSLQQLSDWAVGSGNYPADWLSDYLTNGSHPTLACSVLFRTGLLEVKNELSQAQGRVTPSAPQSLNSGTIKMIISNVVRIELCKDTKRVETDSLDGLTHLMFCMIATGQLRLIAPFHQTVLSALEGGYGVEDGNSLPIGTSLRYAAFGLTIIGDWLGKPLDLDKHALPRDPAWGQLVAHWREPDPDKLAPILVAACDTHVQRIALTSRELDSGNFEFGSPFEAVYPAEILAILNLRRSLGLPNPPIDHPLMKTPYAQLTCPPGMRFEADDLLMRFMAAACKHDPDAVPAGLYEAILQNGAED